MSKTVALTAQSAHSPISVNASDMTRHSPISVNGSDTTRHSPNSPISVNGSDTTQSQHDLSTVLPRPSHDPQERWSRRKGEVNYYGGRQLRRARMSGLSHSRSHEEILHRKLWDIVNSRRKRQLVDETVELMSTGRGPYNSHKPSCPKVKVVPPHFNSDITAALRYTGYTVAVTTILEYIDTPDFPTTSSVSLLLPFLTPALHVSVSLFTSPASLITLGDP
uniref:Uncharacterized protein n=1 Tax=Timema douglasi TaxID=61478 RepID=A0A7R8VY12_TIMDO|nr:unnamed protein product [Timema douglasi]